MKLVKLEMVNRQCAAAKPWLYYGRLAAFFIVSLLLVLYLTFAPAVNRDFYNIQVLFKPVRCDSVRRLWYGRQGDEAYFTNRAGKRLHGLFFPGSGSRVVLVHHGQYRNLEDHLALCGFLLRGQNSLFIYDYAGFGLSEGSPTVAGMIDDAASAYECLTGRLAVAPERVVHFGASLGSGPAALLAAERPCAGLILFSPYISLKDEARDVFPFLKIYPDWLLTDCDFDTVASVARLKVPVLIVHSIDDPCISIRHSDRIYAAAREPRSYLRIAGGNHCLTLLDSVQAGTLEFINLETGQASSRN
ncbi:MAG: alpha/beta hydrolase [Candidatus Obscuribacterales bacterium]